MSPSRTPEEIARLSEQSVHDGERLQHEPVRLNVVIEAPTAAMNAGLKWAPVNADALPRAA